MTLAVYVSNCLETLLRSVRLARSGQHTVHARIGTLSVTETTLRDNLRDSWRLTRPQLLPSTKHFDWEFFCTVHSCHLCSKEIDSLCLATNMLLILHTRIILILVTHDSIRKLLSAIVLGCLWSIWLSGSGFVRGCAWCRYS